MKMKEGLAEIGNHAEDTVGIKVADGGLAIYIDMVAASLNDDKKCLEEEKERRKLVRDLQKARGRLTGVREELAFLKRKAKVEKMWEVKVGVESWRGLAWINKGRLEWGV